VDPVQNRLPTRKFGIAGNRTRDLWICTQELLSLDHRGITDTNQNYCFNYLDLETVTRNGKISKMSKFLHGHCENRILEILTGSL
jgi:hypothetical protein